MFLDEIYISPAKINLYLQVLGKLPDGYHDLDSMVAILNLHDELQFSLSDTNSVLTNGGEFASKVPNFDANIISKVVAEFNKIKPFKLATKITKNIPISAGLGGGSSNAAAAMVYLNKALQLNYDLPKLIDIGIKIGADIPLFLHWHFTGNPVFKFAGKGEQIIDVDDYSALTNMQILLVNPGVEVSTADVFNGLKGLGGRIQDSGLTNIINEVLAKPNDLQNTAIKIAPKIDNVLKYISNILGCRLARMSGSGSTCFGLFDKGVDFAPTNQSYWHILTKFANICHN